MILPIRCKASWYTAKDPGGHPDVAMHSARACQDCGGTGYINDCGATTDCERCHGGWKINPFKFNPEGRTCAIPRSIAKLHGFRYGMLFKITRIHESQMEELIPKKSILVNYNDEGPSEKLAKEEKRWIDLPPGAFRELAPLEMGIITVEFLLME